MQQSSPRGAPMCDRPADPGGCLTVGAALDMVVQQCLHRGLSDTATWLGELSLTAQEHVLAAQLSPSCSLQTAAPIDGSVSGDSYATHVTSLIRLQRQHRFALALYHKGEYQRCHYSLVGALKDYANISAAAAETRTGLQSHISGTPSMPSRVRSVLAAAQFLCFYSLYMDGQRIKSTSTNPHKSPNPHLRVLRGMLTDVLSEVATPSSFLSSSVPAFGAHVSTAPSFVVSPPHPSARDCSSTPRDVHLPGQVPLFASDLLGSQGSGIDGVSRCPNRRTLLSTDPYLCWLLGVVLRDLGMKQEAATYFFACVSMNPLLWCAWEDLATLVSRESQIDEIEQLVVGFEPQFIIGIFIVYLKAALGLAPVTMVHTVSPSPVVQHDPPGFGFVAGAPATQRTSPGFGGSSAASRTVPRLVNAWERLLEDFPRNPFLLTQLAGYHYHQRKDLDRAAQLFEEVRQIDPCRLESAADHSNVLFIKGDRLALSCLAQKVHQVDPFRAEGNFVIGNYYALMGQHDRSVLYFRRATAINPRFVAAWTLLGHAYVETKNTTAAVEAYSTAVDLDPRDYRGWYNLGQIFELLQIYHHALYYYWHTTSLRPTDPRMWAAAGNCLEHDGRRGESVVCLERAEAYESSSADTYPPMVKRICTYYLERRNHARACIYLEKLLHSSAAREDDVLFALPLLVQYRVVQAQQLTELPARSPSYDPTMQVHPSAPLMSRDESGDPRVEQALGMLGQAEEYLERLASMVMPTGASGLSAVMRHVGTNRGATSHASAPRSGVFGHVAQTTAFVSSTPGIRLNESDVSVPPSRRSSTLGGGPERDGSETNHLVKFILRMRREVQLSFQMIAQQRRPPPAPPTRHR